MVAIPALAGDGTLGLPDVALGILQRAAVMRAVGILENQLINLNGLGGHPDRTGHAGCLYGLIGLVVSLGGLRHTALVGIEPGQVFVFGSVVIFQGLEVLEIAGRIRTQALPVLFKLGSISSFIITDFRILSTVP